MHLQEQVSVGSARPSQQNLATIASSRAHHPREHQSAKGNRPRWPPPNWLINGIAFSGGLHQALIRSSALILYTTTQSDESDQKTSSCRRFIDRKQTTHAVVSLPSTECLHPFNTIATGLLGNSCWSPPRRRRINTKRDGAPTGRHHGFARYGLLTNAHQSV
jgi:hypothetical protein